VTITNEDNANPWEEFSASIIPWICQGVLILLSFILLFMAIYKLMIYFVIKTRNKLKCCPFNNAENVLSIEIIAQLIRICYYAIDPSNIHGLIDYKIAFYLVLIPFPLGVLSTVLILIHWNHATSFDSYIEKYRVFFFIANGILIAFFLFVVPVLFTFIDSLPLTIFLSALILAISIVLSIYIFYTAPRVLKFIRKTLHNEKEISKIEKKTRSIFWSGAISIVLFMPVLCFLTNYRGYPYVWYGMFFLWFIFSALLSFAQISVFQPNIKDKKVTSIRTNTSTNM